MTIVHPTVSSPLPLEIWWESHHLNWPLPKTGSSSHLLLNNQWQLCPPSFPPRNFGVILNSSQSLAYRNQMTSPSWSKIWPPITSTATTLIQATIISRLNYSNNLLTSPWFYHCPSTTYSLQQPERFFLKSQIMSLFCSKLSSGFPMHSRKCLNLFNDLQRSVPNSLFSHISTWLPPWSLSSLYSNVTFSMSPSLMTLF